MSGFQRRVLVVSILVLVAAAGVVSGGSVGGDVAAVDAGPIGATGGTAAANGSSSIVVADANVPNEVDRGDSFETSAVIKNEGDAAGTATVRFVFDGSTVLKQSVTLDPGEAVVLDQSVRADRKPGTYTFRVSAADDAAALPVTVLDDTPPEAKASGPTTVDEDTPVTFSGGKSSDNDEVANYEWSFGDGTTAKGEEVTHAFSRPGTYNVTLFVSDPAGNTDSDTATVEVADATKPVAKAGSGRSVTESETVQFDGSDSRDNGRITSYEWSFGDGTSATGVTASHSYDEPGTYDVTLTVTDGGGNSDTDVLTVTVTDDTAPTAEAGKNRTVDEDESIEFDGTGSSDNGKIANYSWTFGDGTTGTGPKPNTTYPDPGTYRVTLTVADTGGNTATDELWVTVRDRTDPTARAGDDRTVTEGESVTFDAGESTDNGDVESYEWSFGDEGSATGRSVSHTYERPGNYTVTLTVTDEAGLEDTTEVEVTVTDATAPTADAGDDVVVDAGREIGDGVAVTFDASNSSDNAGIASYEWEFGDGETATGETVTHEYAKRGNYTATLTVVDGAGNGDTDRRNVTVERLAVSVSDVSGGSSATVEDANAGTSVPVPRADDAGPLASAGNVTVTRLDVGVGRDGDFEVTVTAGDTAPESANALQKAGVAVAGYLRVDHSGGGVKGGTVHFRVGKSFLDAVDGGPSGVALYRYHGGSWNRIAAERVDETGSAYVFRAKAPGFSPFAVGVDVPVFSVSSASLSAPNATNTTEMSVVITRNQSVEVSATVENAGATGGTRPVELKVDGQTVATKDVTVEAGASKSVAFTHTFEETGKRVVFVGGKSTRYVQVKNASATGAGGGGGGFLGLGLLPMIGGGLVVVLLVGGVGLVAYARLARGGQDGTNQRQGQGRGGQRQRQGQGRGGQGQRQGQGRGGQGQRQGQGRGGQGQRQGQGNRR